MSRLKFSWLRLTTLLITILSFNFAIIITNYQGTMIQWETKSLIAYEIDWEIDQQRQEETAERYGEGAKKVVEDVQKNNERNPNPEKGEKAQKELNIEAQKRAAPRKSNR